MSIAMTTKLEQDFETWWEREGQEFLYALNTTTDDDIKLVAEVAWEAALAEQAEREPVAWMVTMENQDGTRKTFPLSGRYKDVRDACDFGDPIPLYTHPVRTKDLTDEEITNEWESMGRGLGKYTEFARAVIAAYKEKNNVK